MFVYNVQTEVLCGSKNWRNVT